MLGYAYTWGITVITGSSLLAFYHIGKVSDFEKIRPYLQDGVTPLIIMLPAR